MLQLEDQKVKVSSVSLNGENHGPDEHATGVTITFKGIADAAILDQFDKKLRGLVFRKLKTGEQLRTDTDNTTSVAVQFPKLDPLSWNEKFPGYEAEFGGDTLFEQEPIQIVDGTLRDVWLRPLEGGSVEFGAKLYCMPEPDEIGQLALLIKNDATLKLTPPSKQAAANDNDQQEAA